MLVAHDTVRTVEERTPSIVGRNLLRLRKQNNLTQAELALASGVKQAQVSQLESGKVQYPNADMLKRFADSLNVAVDDFWEPDAEAQKPAEPSLQEFLASPFGTDVSEAETKMLRQAKFPWGPPTVKGWYHLLEAIRNTE